MPFLKYRRFLCIYLSSLHFREVVLSESFFFILHLHYSGHNASILLYFYVQRGFLEYLSVIRL